MKRHQSKSSALEFDNLPATKAVDCWPPVLFACVVVAAIIGQVLIWIAEKW